MRNTSYPANMRLVQVVAWLVAGLPGLACRVAGPQQGVHRRGVVRGKSHGFLLQTVDAFSPMYGRMLGDRVTYQWTWPWAVVRVGRKEQWPIVFEDSGPHVVTEGSGSLWINGKLAGLDITALGAGELAAYSGRWRHSLRTIALNEGPPARGEVIDFLRSLRGPVVLVVCRSDWGRRELVRLMRQVRRIAGTVSCEEWVSRPSADPWGLQGVRYFSMLSRDASKVVALGEQEPPRPRRDTTTRSGRRKLGRQVWLASIYWVGRLPKVLLGVRSLDWTVPIGTRVGRLSGRLRHGIAHPPSVSLPNLERLKLEVSGLLDQAVGEWCRWLGSLRSLRSLEVAGLWMKIGAEPGRGSCSLQRLEGARLAKLRIRDLVGDKTADQVLASLAEVQPGLRVVEFSRMSEHRGRELPRRGPPRLEALLWPRIGEARGVSVPYYHRFLASRLRALKLWCGRDTPTVKLGRAARWVQLTLGEGASARARPCVILGERTRWLDILDEETGLTTGGGRNARLLSAKELVQVPEGCQLVGVSFNRWEGGKRSMWYPMFLRRLRRCAASLRYLSVSDLSSEGIQELEDLVAVSRLEYLFVYTRAALRLAIPATVRWLGLKSMGGRVRLHVTRVPRELRELYVRALSVDGDALGKLLSSPSLEAFRVRIHSIVGRLDCKPRRESRLRLAQVITEARGQWLSLLQCARGGGGPRVLSVDAPDVDNSVWPALRRMRRLAVLEVHTKSERLQLRPGILRRLHFLTSLYWDTGAPVAELARKAAILAGVRSISLAGQRCKWEDTDKLRTWLQEKLRRRDGVEVVCKGRLGPYCHSPLSGGEETCSYYANESPEVEGGYGWDRPFWSEICLH